MHHSIQIRKAIETALSRGARKIAIFPFGEVGMQTKQILNMMYGLKETFLLDNHLCAYNSAIKPLSALSAADLCDLYVLLSTDHPGLYPRLYASLQALLPPQQIISLPEMEKLSSHKANTAAIPATIKGKYSYGSLCDHWLVERVGAFCSFGEGCDVLPNHPTDRISTHPFLYYDASVDPLLPPYDSGAGNDWYFSGASPRGKASLLKRITVGSDVWLGKGVLITNGASIGHGVIAGAGSVITRDVPDYAVVAGSPARIMRYRYTPEQIAALLQIAWWDWSDETIRRFYADFFLPVSDFIQKHLHTR